MQGSQIFFTIRLQVVKVCLSHPLQVKDLIFIVYGLGEHHVSKIISMVNIVILLNS